MQSQALWITDMILRDAHQSLLATRMHVGDMLPILPKLDAAGYHSLETWGWGIFHAAVDPAPVGEKAIAPIALTPRACEEPALTEVDSGDHLMSMWKLTSRIGSRWR
jgi:hypothetical protein